MRIRWVLRLLGWNALLLLVGIVLIAMAGEAYLWLTKPLQFMTPYNPFEFVPNVGRLRPPNTEIRSTNGLDFWTVSRTNSLGFLDREPPSPERAAATCHISMIGDSFVEAKEVPIRDKFHVRLEALAAEELPHLNVTTSAFGITNTGQVQQLPFYDEYARRLSPKLLVLVFVPNDFRENTPIHRTLAMGLRVGENFLEPMVRRRPDRKLELAWSNPLNNIPSVLRRRPTAAMYEAVQRSRFARWLRDKKIAFFPPPPPPRWQSGFRWYEKDLKRQEEPLNNSGIEMETFQNQRFQDTLQYTAFALEQFKQRADRDGAKLVILASHMLKTHGTLLFERMSKMAATLDIPVIDQTDYILRQGYKLTDAHWPHDGHWNPAGHRWAAEALLEYIKEHPAICDGPT